MNNKNIKSTLISVATIIVLFGGLIWLSRNETGNGEANISQSGGGTLSAEEISFDFGAISMANGKVSHIFKIKNESGEPAMISKIYTSCMCTEATLTRGDKKSGPFGMPGHSGIPKINETINPGESVDVEAVFDPAAHGPSGVGLADRVVFVEDGAGQQLQLKFKAMVTP
ncbi:MAG: DUF1573 domain-containing protein [Candidatus Yanofskybacteria bacterium]|nr:DUF1573 domain-containing protein [Candidatus Yanofskybacteria bacterium]